MGLEHLWKVLCVIPNFWRYGWERPQECFPVSIQSIMSTINLTQPNPELPMVPGLLWHQNVFHGIQWARRLPPVPPWRMGTFIPFLWVSRVDLQKARNGAQLHQFYIITFVGWVVLRWRYSTCSAEMKTKTCKRKVKTANALGKVERKPSTHSIQDHCLLLRTELGKLPLPVQLVRSIYIFFKQDPKLLWRDRNSRTIQASGGISSSQRMEISTAAVMKEHISN